MSRHPEGPKDGQSAGCRGSGLGLLSAVLPVEFTTDLPPSDGFVALILYSYLEIASAWHVRLFLLVPDPRLRQVLA